MQQNTLSQRSSWEHGYTAQEKQDPKKCFLTTLKTVLPELGKEGRFQDWYGLACDETTWEERLNVYLTKIRKNNETEGTDAETNEP